MENSLNKIRMNSIFGVDTDNVGECEPEIEWVWVEGYKGTNKDMMCQSNYQFELGKQYDMDCKDEEIEECQCGFHLCENLLSVFNYYPVGDGNRYFKVKALVKTLKYKDENPKRLRYKLDKFVAKTIIFEEEVPESEILEVVRRRHSGRYDVIKEMDDERLRKVLELGVDELRNQYLMERLINDGYPEPLAKYLVVDEGGYRIINCAHALASIPDMDMVTKIKLIFNRVSNSDDC